MELKSKGNKIVLNKTQSKLRKQKSILKVKQKRIRNDSPGIDKNFAIKQLTRKEVRFRDGSKVEIKQVVDAIEKSGLDKQTKKRWKSISKTNKIRIAMRLVDSGAVLFKKEEPLSHESLNVSALSNEIAGYKSTNKELSIKRNKQKIGLSNNIAFSRGIKGNTEVESNKIVLQEENIVENEEDGSENQRKVQKEKNESSFSAGMLHDKQRRSKRSAKETQIEINITGEEFQEGISSNNQIHNDKPVSKQRHLGRAAKRVGGFVSITAVSIGKLAEIMSEEDQTGKIKNMVIAKAKSKIYNTAAAPGKKLVKNVAGNALKGVGIVLKKVLLLLQAALAPILPFILIGLSIISIFIILITSIMGIFQTNQGSGTGRANVSEACERYRPLVVKYAKLYDMEPFVEIIMCIMMQESGGNSEQYPDIMQSSEYAGLPVNSLGIEESVDYGVQAIRDAMQVAGCKSPSELDKLKLALQGYNYGSGYVSWAITHYGGYSKDNAIIFSNMMVAQLGWSRYGDPDYVDHVFQYYVFTGGYSPDGIANEEAVQQLSQLSATWPASMDERRGAVIAKGASLIGFTTYDMFGEDTRAGVDLPRTLDCSSFTAWAFQKSGFTDVPYGSTTGTFVASSNFRPITVSELIPGDIGLMNTIAAGGSNHVGIYAGEDPNGSKMFLHCTSHATAGSSIINGPRISYYSSFQIFYRYTGFVD